MFKKDDTAQGSMFLYMMLSMLILYFLAFTGVGELLGIYFGLVLYPVIGFGGQYPVLTIFFAGLIVVFISSLLTNFFTNWKKLGESQETYRAFQKEMMKARKENNTSRLSKLMKMQPAIMKKQTESSSGTMKSMLFLMIFILPIFMWLRMFLMGLPHYYFTVPWAEGVSFFGSPFGFGQAWLWLYLIFSMVAGQIIRQGLKYISWSDRWKNIKEKIRPTSVQ